MDFGVDTLLSATLLVDIQTAVGDRLDLLQFTEVREKWDKVVGLFHRRFQEAGGGARKTRTVTPLFLSSEEEQADELYDDGVSLVDKAPRAGRSAKAAGKQKEGSKRRNQRGKKVFDEDLHEYSDPNVCLPRDPSLRSLIFSFAV